MPVVAVQMVSGPDESRFYRRILAAIGAPEPPRATLSVLESLALRLLTELRPGMLVIDEIHSLQAGTIREQARFLNMLRFLGNELRIPLVCVGTAQARNALRTDDQLVRRFEAFVLPWREGEDLNGLMSTLTRTLLLRRESQIDEKALTRMIKVTGGITSGIFSILSQLAIAAIESGEEIFPVTFWAATGCRRSWESRCDGARAPAGCLPPRGGRTAVFLGRAHGPVLRHDGFGIRRRTWSKGARRVRPGMASFGRAGGPDCGPHRSRARGGAGHDFPGVGGCGAHDDRAEEPVLLPVLSRRTSTQIHSPAVAISLPVHGWGSGRRRRDPVQPVRYGLLQET